MDDTRLLWMALVGRYRNMCYIDSGMAFQA